MKPAVEFTSDSAYEAVIEMNTFGQILEKIGWRHFQKNPSGKRNDMRDRLEEMKKGNGMSHKEVLKLLDKEGV